MKNILFLFLLAPMLLIAQDKPIGINLSGVHDYSTEFVFVDAMKQCREWISYQSDDAGPWDTNVEVPLLANGYPVEIPYDDGINPPQNLRTLMLWDLPEGAFPAGMFRLIVEGSGTVQLQFGATGSYSTPIDTYVYADGALALEIEYSDPDDPISDIQFILPEYTEEYETKTFTDDFVEFVDDFDNIRFMDWLRTNNSPMESWSERSLPDYYTQTTEKGVAWEYILELTALLEKDIWINIPHRAEDAYIEELANLLNTEIDPDIDIYLEYSNELWNSIFTQNQYAAQEALSLGFTGEAWERTWKYTAKRSADVFHIFENVFENDQRLTKVIPSQAANPWLSGQLINFFNDAQYNPNSVEADALAIAPYFAGAVANEIVAENLVSEISVEQVVDRMEDALPEAYSWMQGNQTEADQNNLDLLVYEGGQHLVATGDNVNIDELTTKLMAANHHPDLQEVYCQYLDHWYEQHGGLFMHFSSHFSYSKWGSWGIKETMDDFNNPKYLALQECVLDESSSLGASVDFQHTVQAYPNPSYDQYVRLNSDIEMTSIQVFNAQGKQVDVDINRFTPFYCELVFPTKGVHFIRVNNQLLKQIQY